MSPALPRAPFNSSKLIRLLAGLAVTDTGHAPQALAERLGPWLDWTDAIALSTVLNAPLAPPAARRSDGPRPHAAAAEACRRVRTDLAQAMAKAGQALTAQAGPKPAAAATVAPRAETADFLPYRQHCLAQQRAMDRRIGPLREQVRALAAGHSPRLGQLAALDAVMDQALAARERHVLSSVPQLLEKHFHRLHQAHLAHQAMVSERQQAGACNPGIQPAGWMDNFLNDMHAVLLAELDSRLQPVEGLIAALANEV